MGITGEAQADMRNSGNSRRIGKHLLLLKAVLFIAVGGSCSFPAPPPFDEAKWRLDVERTQTSDLYAPHFKDGKFFNPWMSSPHGGFVRFMRWKLGCRSSYTEEEESHRPGFVPHLSSRMESAGNGDYIAWIGHGTFLIKINGEFWVTDPILTDRALLPRRKTPPAMTIEEMAGLPGRLNIVISHNHYDHLDAPTIRGLPADARVFVPLGLKDYVRGLGKPRVEELDWWQEIDCWNGVRIICLPAQHWSRRITQSTNSTLWASYLLVSNRTTIYFGGDSGYFLGYREIGRRFQGIDYALLPLTAYHPRWFMHYAHTDANETLDAFEDLGARVLIPTQWGTFRLGDEPIGYPALDLQRAVQKRGLDASRIRIMDLGQIVPVEPQLKP